MEGGFSFCLNATFEDNPSNRAWMKRNGYEWENAENLLFGQVPFQTFGSVSQVGALDFVASTNCHKSPLDSLLDMAKATNRLGWEDGMTYISTDDVSEKELSDIRRKVNEDGIVIVEGVAFTCIVSPPQSARPSCWAWKQED